MAKTKFIALKDSDPLALCMKSGTVVLMSDGWRGAVHHDDGKTVLLIKDGERMNAAFKGQRGLLRQPINVRGLRMIGRSQVVDLAAHVKYWDVQ